MDLYKSTFNQVFKIIQFTGLTALSIFFITAVVFGIYKDQLDKAEGLVFALNFISLSLFIVLTFVHKSIRGGMTKIGSIEFHDMGFKIIYEGDSQKDFTLRDYPRILMKLSDYTGEIDVSLQLNFSKNKGIENFIWTDWDLKNEYYRFRIPSDSAYNKLIKIGYSWQQQCKSTRVEY